MSLFDIRSPPGNTNLVVDYQGLLYRSQFILGPEFVDIFQAPKRLTIRDGLNVTVHPELNVRAARHKEKKIVLLGFILDPENPQASDAEIVEIFAKQIKHGRDLFHLTSRFGGRWILIVDDGTEVLLFNDPAGLRQVFYSDPRLTQYLWCGSQPGLIADQLGLQMSEDASEFLHSTEVARNPEYWWPGDSSPYREVRHLLPNHYLNLRSGTRHRYWPSEKLTPLSLETAVRECSRLLTGLLAAAAERYDLALALTAGWDSRLLLAASKGICNKLSYFTLKIKAANLTEDHPDLAVPRDLLASLNLKHDVIELPQTVDGQFATMFRRSVVLDHDIWQLDAQAIYEFYGLQKVVIAGGMSEAARNFYTLPRFVEKKLNGEKLASLAGMGRNRFAVKNFNEWLHNLGPTYNLRILDLFYWEQRAGNWLAMCQKEFDVAWREIFSPYNCRHLLTKMLAVNSSYRSGPEFQLYRELMGELWPSVLKKPINPHKAPTTAKVLKQGVRNQLLNVKYFFVNR